MKAKPHSCAQFEDCVQPNICMSCGDCILHGIEMKDRKIDWSMEDTLSVPPEHYAIRKCA